RPVAGPGVPGCRGAANHLLRPIRRAHTTAADAACFLRALRLDLDALDRSALVARGPSLPADDRRQACRRARSCSLHRLRQYGGMSGDQHSLRTLADRLTDRLPARRRDWQRRNAAGCGERVRADAVLGAPCAPVTESYQRSTITATGPPPSGP